MLVLTMSNCSMTSSTSGFGKDVLLERYAHVQILLEEPRRYQNNQHLKSDLCIVLDGRSIMNSWKSSWMLLNKYMVKRFSSRSVQTPSKLHVIWWSFWLFITIILNFLCTSLKTLPITMHLICLRNIARVILFSMMISRLVNYLFQFYHVLPFCSSVSLIRYIFQFVAFSADIKCVDCREQHLWSLQVCYLHWRLSVEP